MNYAGKFDAAISLDGQGFHSPGYGHVDSFTTKAHGHVPDGAFVVPDPNLIFNGEFKRAGLDLVLSHDGHEFVVHDYFRGDKRAALASADGAHLTGDVVNALTGHVQYAQAAGGIAAAQVIGHVTKLSGSATAVRNGVSVILNNGDNVEKGDVVSTGADSTLGITFIDGTVFGLSSNARMVLNEMVYDPNGSNNSSLLSLVAGTITFVAGETAKHGDMKVDTPVATMGIRGTAVLSQINFVIPAGGGDPQPQASFQVLVEPNGTTGSYILFDKVTLLPIATVNQAGQMIQISGGNVSISNALMSPDIQKLITDVFTLKFTDNNSNTKLTTNFTDTITQNGNIVVIKTDTGATATATFTNPNQQGSQDPSHNPATSTRVPGSPDSRSLDANGNVRTAFTLTEHTNATGDRADGTGDAVPSDTVSGRITFVDQNLGDAPTVSVSLGDAPNYVYKSGSQDVTGTLSALQKQDIAATQIQISVVAEGGNNNNGSAVWTYTIPDHVFDFLADGETLTLTYMVRVNNNFAVNPETTLIPITITITGSNDKPVITTSVPTITFAGGTKTEGGPLTSEVPTSGTLTFTDVDLTDTHSVSVTKFSAVLPGGTVPQTIHNFLASDLTVSIASGHDSTGSGTGTVNWSLGDIPVYLADFIPKDAVLTLTYTVTVKDAKGATSDQTITVTITGTDSPAVVWIATKQTGSPSGGLWSTGANWETGVVPTIDDDVIVITNQLMGLSPSYPVTINAAAYGKSLSMNDFDTDRSPQHIAPEVDNQSSLTIAGQLKLEADSVFANFAAGTVSIGGNAEILDTSVLKNFGYLTLAGGGDFAIGTSITNSGTIELSGGTLKTLATIHNAGGTLKADAGTTLIVDTATLDGGTVTILGTLELDGTSLIENGTLNNSGAVNVKGTAEFAHETVSNTASGTIKVLANGWLTIDQGSHVNNSGAVTVDASGKLTVNGATIGAAGGVIGTGGGEGGPVFNALISSTGTITNNGEIDLTGSAILSGGILNNNAVFNVSGTGNALSHETVTSSATGTIEVLGNGVLKIDQGSTVTNTGNVTVDATGKLTVNGATISGAGTVTDNGEIDLTGNAVLSGGVLKNNATFKVSGTGNALDNEAITNGATGTIEVLGNGALTIDLGSTLANAGNVTVDATGKLTVNGATISDAGTVTGNGEIDLTGNAVLSGGILKNNATFKVSGAGNALDNEAITNAGTIEVLGSGALLIDQGSTVENSSGNVIVDTNAALTLRDARISGGAIKGAGTIDVTAASKIDAGATLSASVVIADAKLTLDGVTVSGSTITDNSSIELANTVTLKDSAKIQGTSAASRGAITNGGTLEIAGAAMLLNDVVTNTGTMTIDGSQTLTLSGTDITGGTISNYSGLLGGTIHVTGSSAINGNATLNKGAVTVDSGVTLTFGDATITGTSITNHGTVNVATSKTTTLNGASLTGGTLTVSGTLASTGTSLIDSANITNTGTITVTGGTLTIDPATLHTITNQSLIQANGGVLDISGENISNSADLKAINAGTLKLTHLTVSNSVTGAVTVGTSSKLYLTDVSINGGSLSNAGNLYSVSGANTVTGGVTNTGGTIEVQGGTLNLSGGITGLGTLIIDNGATLELGGADAQTITFAGGTSTLQLDKVAGQSFAGTIAAKTSANGTFTVTGTADITTSAGDALDFSVSAGAHANVVLTPTGTLTGAASGIVVTQNGAGNISLTATKDIVGLNGNGITLRDTGSGTGSITINNLTGKATGTGATSDGILVENLNAANAGNISITQLGGAAGGAFGIDAQTKGNGNVGIDAGGNITGAATYGIRARSYGSGDITVTTETGSVVTSGSSGIVAVNRAILLDAPNDSTITINSYGTINSGSSLNLATNSPGGIEVGYTGADSGTNANTAVNGTVVVNNHGNITAAAGYGINAYNYGNGDVTVTSFIGTTISVAGLQSVGINAVALSGGTGNVTVTLGENVTISGATSYGIRAHSVDAGDISVTLAKGDSITSGSSGIVAVNFATTILDAVDSTISVEAHGNIHSGTTLNQDLTTPGAIIAGYKPGGNATFSNAVNGDVTVTSDATITADAGYGIDAFTWGIGDVTVTTGLLSSITATAGTAIGAFSHGGGDVSVTNDGSATGTIGLSAVAAGAGDVTIVNHGHITGTSLAGISVTQNDADAAGDPVATGSTHITNSGSVVGAAGHAAIFIAENTTGSATIDNTGTIGPTVANVTSTTYAIVETGGAVTINNTGAIDGNIAVAHATFNNNAGGTWTVAGSGVFGNASSIVNHGAIDLHGASISGTGLSITNYTDIDSWGTASISGTISNAGSIEVHDGALTLFGTLSGTGSVTVDVGALLKLDGSVTQTINLAGDGAKLQIDTSAFGGAIGELSKTDTIDLSTIKFGVHTTADYVANSDPLTGGTLTVTGEDGQTISLKLTGADYSGMHFAGTNDGTGHTLITINAADGAPAIQAGATLAATVAERDSTTGSGAHDPSPTAATGAIDFKDIDLTDRPTATITSQSVTWFDTNGTTHLPLTGQEAALEQALTLLPQTNKNNGTVTWSYSVTDSALDFLGENQTAKVVSTITLDDQHGQKTTADVTITLTGKNDAPVVEVKAANDSAGATLPETNAGLHTTGTLTLSDADATDHVTVSDSSVAVYFQGDLKADGFDGLWDSDLLNYFTVPSGNILNGAADHAQFAWDLNSGSQPFDFLAAGQTLKLQYTIVPDDGHTATGTGNGVVTITVTGTNDAPTLDNTTLGSVAGNHSNPGGSSISDLFANKFHDVDAGASFKAIAVTSDAATADQGVWQYETGGHWADIGSVDNTHGLVLSTDTLIRFVPAYGYTGTPGALGVHALDDTYAGHVTTAASTETIDLTATGTGGTTPVSHDLTTIGTSVTAPVGGPVINTDDFYIWNNNESNTETIMGLSVSGSSAETYALNAFTTGAAVGSSVTPSADHGLALDQLNTEIAEGTYHPGATPPVNERVVFSVTDSTGASDTVNFVFNESGSGPVSLVGTTGKDVLFGTGSNDTLDGNGGKDQFVFGPASGTVQHTVLNFDTTLDKIDLRQFGNIGSIDDLVISSQPDGALVTLDHHETILLKNVIAGNLHASDFIFGSGHLL